MRKRLLALFCCAALAASASAAAAETPVNLARGKSYTVEKGRRHLAFLCAVRGRRRIV